MIAPTLLVGLGGTGSKIVSRVSKMVTEEQRKHIGFAVFDTDINELREIREANPYIKTIQTSTKLTVGEYLNIDTHARDTWFPVNGILNSKSLTEGAGQVRAISRLALDTAIRAGNMEPLHKAIEELYKLEGDSGEQALRVVIVSSLAGGTGSGLILPVALYLKNYLATKFQASANITRGFFILPEVFYEVIRGQSERNNLRCNAYAALRELDAFLMKGDKTLPEKYDKTVRVEFPRVGSSEVEEYDVRPYDFCFLFDAQNTEGKKLNSFNQYLDHAANCIYSQSIGPMNKRSNSSEDNTIRELCAQRGRNRYAGAGSAMLIYPTEDVKEYIALNWAKECVSKQWLVFDDMYRERCMANSEMRAQGFHVNDIDPSMSYIGSIEQMAKQKDPFAKAIEEACTIYDDGGYKKVSDKWSEYVDQLKKFVKTSVMTGQLDLDSQKRQAMGLINDIEVGKKEAKEDLQSAFMEVEKYKDMVMRRSEDSGRTIAYTIFRAKNDSATKDRLPHQMETYLRDQHDAFIHPNAVRYFLYQALELMKQEKVFVDKENKKKEKFFDDFYNIFDDPKTDETETVDQLTEGIVQKIKEKLSGKKQQAEVQPAWNDEELEFTYSEGEEQKPDPESTETKEPEQLVQDDQENHELTEYQKHCFLKYGYDEIDGFLDFAGTTAYLAAYGYDHNPLQQVRDKEKAAQEYIRAYDPDKLGAHFCDFCGVEIAGGEYDVLKDGRERCSHCSSTALRTGEEFKDVYKMVLRNMEIFYGIKINAAIKVRMTDARTIAKHFGEDFVPTPGVDGRVLGFAQKDASGYSLYIENGSPRLAAMATIAHELTHIWQYQNWDDKKIIEAYGAQNRLEVYEGMAKWAEIQYLLYLNETAYGKREQVRTMMRKDEYGRGFIQYMKKYSLSYQQEKKRTPFQEFPPL